MKRNKFSLSLLILLFFVFGAAAPALSANNVALDGTATQSSTDFGGVASRAIDGNTDGSYWDGSVTHTAYQSQPWWQVDLRRTFRIDSIRIWNRTDCCMDRLSNFTVSVLDSKQHTVWSRAFSSYPDPDLTITLPADTTGQIVQVQLNNTEFLSLAEVQVFGTLATPVPALSTWGIILFAGLAGFFSVWQLRRQKQVHNPKAEDF